MVAPKNNPPIIPICNIRGAYSLYYNSDLSFSPYTKEGTILSNSTLVYKSTGIELNLYLSETPDVIHLTLPIKGDTFYNKRVNNDRLTIQLAGDSLNYHYNKTVLRGCDEMLDSIRSYTIILLK